MHGALYKNDSSFNTQKFLIFPRLFCENNVQSISCDCIWLPNWHDLNSLLEFKERKEKFHLFRVFFPGETPPFANRALSAEI